MFEIKHGMIEIKGDAEHIFTRMTPQEWESMMLNLLDKRHAAIQQKLAVKDNRASTFPSRPAEMSIGQYVEWKQACDKVNALNCQIDARIQLAAVIVRNCEKSIVEAMPENVKLVIHDAALEAYSVWWTRRYDSEGCRVNDLRIEILSPRPDTSADELPVVPMSQQLSPDLPDEEEDLDPATESDNAFGYDDEEEIGGVPSEYSGENDEPPARVNPVSQQIDGDDLESDALWDIETDEDGLEVEYEDEDTVDEYGDDISF